MDSNEDNRKDDRAGQYKKIGLNIAFYRKLKGLTQMQLAEQVGISRTHMSNIEAPAMVTTMSIDVLLSIAEALEIEPYKLLVMRE